MLFILYTSNVLVKLAVNSRVLMTAVFNLFILHLMNCDLAYFVPDLVELVGVLTDVGVLFGEVCAALIFDGDVLFHGFT